MQSKHCVFPGGWLKPGDNDNNNIVGVLKQIKVQNNRNDRFDPRLSCKMKNILLLPLCWNLPWMLQRWTCSKNKQTQQYNTIINIRDLPFEVYLSFTFTDMTIIIETRLFLNIRISGKQRKEILPQSYSVVLLVVKDFKSSSTKAFCTAYMKGLSISRGSRVREGALVADFFSLVNSRGNCLFSYLILAVNLQEWCGGGDEISWTKPQSEWGRPVGRAPNHRKFEIIGGRRSVADS